MAMLLNCFCCSLAIAGGFLAVYLLVTYLIAFGFELLWILESDVALPTAAVLLCAGYFTLALFAALLIHGVATKNTLCLLAWMFAVVILIFPEAGMVIYMSIQYWRIESLYGMTELACWFARILANAIALIVIHSLYSMWKEEKLINKRLRDLTLAAITIPRDASLSLNSLNGPMYQNNAFDHSLEQLHLGMKRTTSVPQIWTDAVPNNLTIPYDEYHQFCTTQSEFNASIFVPNFVHDEMHIPYTAKKTQSLMDLRMLDETIVEEKISQQWQPWMSQSITETNGVLLPSYNHNAAQKVNSRLPKYASVDALNDINKSHHIIKNRTGFYAQPLPNYGVPIYYGPLDGPDFLIYKKQVDKLNSKNSLSNTSVDDVQKYRDVAL